MKIKRYAAFFILLNVFLFVSPTTVIAGADSGIYIGAGIGDAALTDKGTDPTNGNYDFDENDVGYKIFGGYNFGYVPLVDIAAEISYVDFGKPSAAFANGEPINFEITGVNVFGLVGINLGPLGLFAKVGVINWDMDSTFGTSSTSDDGTDPAYGVGAKIQFSSFAVRAEYEAYDINPVNNLDMVSLSLVYTF